MKTKNDNLIFLKVLERLALGMCVVWVVLVALLAYGLKAIGFLRRLPR